MLMFLALTAKCRIQESYLRICAGATDIRSCKGLRPSEKVSDGLGYKTRYLSLLHNVRKKFSKSGSLFEEQDADVFGLRPNVGFKNPTHLRRATDIRSCKGLRPSEKSFRRPGLDRYLAPAQAANSRKSRPFEEQDADVFWP